jgi:4a-hydroxytetrahydrobiopterin dehydratase
MRADSPTEIGTTAQCKIGGRAGQAGKGRFAAQPPAMRPGTEQRRRRDGANAAAGRSCGASRSTRPASSRSSVGRTAKTRYIGFVGFRLCEAVRVRVGADAMLTFCKSPGERRPVLRACVLSRHQPALVVADEPKGDTATPAGIVYRGRYSDPTRSRLRGADSRETGRLETLTQMKCVACRKDAPTATDAEIAEFHRQVSDWDIVELDGIKRLRRVFSVDGFAQALEFTKKVGELAEEEGHHPALLTEWGRTTVTWWTHKIKGLHRNDFIMAAKTDELYQP